MSIVAYVLAEASTIFLYFPYAVRRHFREGEWDVKQLLCKSVKRSSDILDGGLYKEKNGYPNARFYSR